MCVSSLMFPPGLAAAQMGSPPSPESVSPKTEAEPGSRGKGGGVGSCAPAREASRGSCFHTAPSFAVLSTVMPNCDLSIVKRSHPEGMCLWHLHTSSPQPAVLLFKITGFRMHPLNAQVTCFTGCSTKETAICSSDRGKMSGGGPALRMCVCTLHCIDNVTWFFQSNTGSCLMH